MYQNNKLTPLMLEYLWRLNVAASQSTYLSHEAARKYLLSKELIVFSEKIGNKCKITDWGREILFGRIEKEPLSHIINLDQLIVMLNTKILQIRIIDGMIIDFRVFVLTKRGILNKDNTYFTLSDIGLEYIQHLINTRLKRILRTEKDIRSRKYIYYSTNIELLGQLMLSRDKDIRLRAKQRYTELAKEN